MGASFATSRAVILILAAATLYGPALESQPRVRAASLELSATRTGEARKGQQPVQVLKSNPIHLLDCERVITLEGALDESELCFAMLEALLQSNYMLDAVRTKIAASESNTPLVSSHPQQNKSRRDARSPMGSGLHRSAPPLLVQESLAFGADALKGHSGEALSKLLMNGLAAEAAAGDELMMLDGSEKPLWGSMSDGMHSRWQPMRGKRILSQS